MPHFRANPRTTHIHAGIAALNWKPRAEVHNFREALSFLGGADAKVLGSNVEIRVMENDDKGVKAVGVVLYQTEILRYYRSGRFWADSGGHNTPTTRERLNALAPYGWRYFHFGGKKLWGDGKEMSRDKLYRVSTRRGKQWAREQAKWRKEWAKQQAA